VKVYLLGANNPEAVRMLGALRCAEPGSDFAFLDNDPAKAGTLFWGVPVLGGADRVPELNGRDVRFVNLITRDTVTRCETTRQLVDAGAELTNFIHPSVDLTMVTVGTGVYLQDGVMLQADVQIGDNSSVSTGCVISHECRIGASVFLAPSVSIAGCVDVGDGVFFGINSTVLPRLKIGRWATIGAGAVVTRDVPEYAVVVGNPARVIKFLPPVHSHGRITL
jgi:sugar O-acyltransferase (sialic acid O-acetyltransferase NeuD family)